MISTVLYDDYLDPSLICLWESRLVTDDPQWLFVEAKMLVVDGTDWGAGMDVLQGALSKKKRAFKEPFNEGNPKPDVKRQIDNVTRQATRLFKGLYPDFKSIMERVSWRPMVTGPEPLHLDTTHNDAPLVTAYVNISPEPRIYNIGPSLPMLLRSHPEEMRALFKKAHKPSIPLDVSYELRQALPGGPLGSKAPRHQIKLAPGAIWFFNAKTVSHEVIYGRGAIGISWECPGCGAKSQAELYKEMLA